MIEVFNMFHVKKKGQRDLMGIVKILEDEGKGYIRKRISKKMFNCPDKDLV